MIKFHYHTARTSVPRLEIREGDPLCHVYSDTSIAELAAWGRRHGLKASWMDRSHSLPHYDVKVESFDGVLGPGVERAELVGDIRAWREGRETRGGSETRGGRSPSL